MSSMTQHLKSAHAWENKNKGRPSKAAQGKGKATVLSTVTTSPVYYQTFHVSNFRRNFRVAMPLKPDQGAPEPEQPPPPTSLEAQVELQLLNRWCPCSVLYRYCVIFLTIGLGWLSLWPITFRLL